jgi:hypothetical protein
MRILAATLLAMSLAFAPIHQADARGSHSSSHSSSSHSSSRSHSSGDVHVRGYTKKDGTYVAPHYRSHPDKSYNNNWSVKGNTNPYTGKAGTKNPTSNDKPPPKPTPPSI